jgi:hypothetical protein
MRVNYPAQLPPIKFSPTSPGYRCMRPVFHEMETLFRIAKFCCAPAPSAVFTGRKIIPHRAMEFLSG